MSGRIPSALEPYLHLPPSRSLTILTSILGTSINWLVLRFLYISLRAGGSQSVGRGNETDKKSEDYQVVLVSFLRDWSFWKEHTARAVCSGLCDCSKKYLTKNRVLTSSHCQSNTDFDLSMA
jgi:hypothetical protein